MSVLLLSDWSKTAKSVPGNYILPPNQRPEDAEISKDIPVIDLSQGKGEGKVKLLEQIIRACHDYGMFQVINHGVPEKLMDDTMRLCKEFFDLPAEDKATLYSHDESKKCRLYSGHRYHSEERTESWKDSLRHPCHPVEDHMQLWPEKPPSYRQVIGAYAIEVRELGLKILDLMCEGLGIEMGYFRDELSKDQTLGVNHFPPCPNPSLTLGLESHKDPNLLTILQQEVYGLQILKDDKWIGVEHLPRAFVISVSSQLEVISNGKLKSVQHRAVTNADVTRMSIVNFIAPSMECIIEPAKGLVNANNRPIFKAFKYKDFYKTNINMRRRPGTGTALEHFKL